MIVLYHIMLWFLTCTFFFFTKLFKLLFLNSFIELNLIFPNNGLESGRRFSNVVQKHWSSYGGYGDGGGGTRKHTVKNPLQAKMCFLQWFLWEICPVYFCTKPKWVTFLVFFHRGRKASSPLRGTVCYTLVYFVKSSDSFELNVRR